jgi:hypothetical protein
MTANKHDLHSFMAQASDEMAAEYARIRSRAKDDPGTAGDEGEENWAGLLRNWLPAGYHVETKGRLIGADGSTSKQVDVVVLKPSYPTAMLKKKVWLAGGVAAVFECKTTLKARHISDAGSTCEGLKRLFPQRVGTPRLELASPIVYGILAHSSSWKGRQSTPLENIGSALEGMCQSTSEPRLGLDIVCVSDLATWHSTYVAAKFAPRADRPGGFPLAGGPMTTMIGASLEGERQRIEFRPLGALVATLIQRLAWEDPALRALADYYRLTNLAGSGEGRLREWPLSVYSEPVQSRVLSGALKNGVIWDDWALSGY